MTPLHTFDTALLKAHVSNYWYLETYDYLQNGAHTALQNNNKMNL